jgi:hypothetical protein
MIKTLRNDDPEGEVLLEGLDDDQQPLRLTYGTITGSSYESSDDKSKDNPFLQPYVPLPVTVRTFGQKMSFRQSNRSRAFLSSDDEEALRREEYIQTGSILHEVFSTIRTAEDIPAALQHLQAEGVIYDSRLTSEHIASLLRKRLQNTRVADWFSGRWTLYNECTILSTDADGQTVQQRPDRVMTDGHQWIVVDFKFGSPKPEYHDQVRRYMSLLASMGHQNIHGYLWYVYTNRIEEV